MDEKEKDDRIVLMAEPKEEAEPDMAFWLTTTAVFLSVNLLRGIVAQAYWKWFLLPTFGVETPSLAVCVGIVLLLNVIAPAATKGAGEIEKPGDTVMINLVGLSLMMFLGWLLSWVV